MVKSIILMRHAEREDRAQEEKGLDWISTAPRPQDPLLSAEGAIASSQTKKYSFTYVTLLYFATIRERASKKCRPANENLGNHKNFDLADDPNGSDLRHCC